MPDPRKQFERYCERCASAKEKLSANAEMVVLSLRRWAYQDGQSAVARELGVSPQRLNDFLSGRRGVVDLAIRGHRSGWPDRSSRGSD